MYSEASGLSSCLASVVLCDGGIDRILNVGHRLVMVNICCSSQKQFRYVVYTVVQKNVFTYGSSVMLLYS